MRIPSFDPLLTACDHLSEGEREDVRKAYEFAVRKHEGQTREDGSPYVLHVIDVAIIMAEWQADRDAIVAALLHDTLEDTQTTKEEILEQFGKRVGLLVEGITKFTQADLNPALDLERKTETLRKLFDIMRLDIRSILVKLADRLHNVRTIDSLSSSRRERFARETMDVYYKIAFHLGMRQLRREFAEQCIPYVFPEGVHERMERDRLCQQFRTTPYTIERYIKAQEGASGIEEIFLQPRNLQIFHDKKEARDGATLSQDAFSIVAIVTDEESCYHFLKSVHTLYRPVAGQFRDFIAAPSEAGYQSLHTHVSLPEGGVIEIRIYTPEMYQNAMSGIVHSLFGHGAAGPSFGWLQRSEELDLKTRESSSAFWEALESDILRETISVSVDRQRISLPNGATALDAVFALHNHSATRTLRISVNGVEESFSSPLKEDDDVHTTLAEFAQVSFDWLDAVSTRHARFLISEELKQHSRAEKISLGATILQRELDHYGKGLIQHLSRSQCQSIADKYRRSSFDQVLSMIGEGVLRPRDVVFFLFPEEQKRLTFWRPASDLYRFRLAVEYVHSKQDSLSLVTAAAREHGVTVDAVTQQQSKDRTELQIAGHADSRLQFADFVETLERHESCVSVQTLIPAAKKAILMTSFLLAFLVIFIDVLLLPWYEQVLTGMPFLPQIILQALPLLPILVANLYLLRLLRQYVVRMRNDRWYLVVGFLLNLIGLIVLSVHSVYTTTRSLWPLIGIFVLFVIAIGYRFLRTEALFAPFDDQKLKPVSDTEWQARVRHKRTGYIIRFAAVIIWGLEPIIIRYSPANDLTPFLRTFLYGLGAMIPMTAAYLLIGYLRTRKRPTLTLPYDGSFFALVVGQVGFFYFMNASLIYTSGTNLLLFNTFAPICALVVAAFFWRKDIPYLRQPKVMLMIFLLAVTGGIGSSLLIQNSLQTRDAWSAVGDILAMIAMFFDVLLVIGQIQYIKHFIKTNGMLLNMHVFSFVLLFIAPIIIISSFFGIEILKGLTRSSLLWGMAIGLMIGVGQLLNYEAFKRIDGYLAYMMFNISVLITFVAEAFFLRTIQPTFLLILSGVMIIGASVFAEIVNSRCEKKGL